jgi:hypothetical protein
VAVEVLAEEVLGAEAHKEHKLLSDKLGGTRNNRVFAFFEFKVPPRVVKARLIEADEKKAKAEAAGEAGGKAKKVAKEAAAPRGGKTTGALEKKKRRGGGGGARPAKRSRLVDALFSESPLRSKGDSEAEVASSEDNVAAGKTLAAPISMAVHAKPAFSLQLRHPKPESDDEVRPQPHAAYASAAAARKRQRRWRRCLAKRMAKTRKSQGLPHSWAARQRGREPAVGQAAAAEVPRRAVDMC